MGRFRRLSELSGQNVSERRAGSENAYRRSRPSTRKGKAVARGPSSDNRPPGSAGVLALARRKRTATQHGRPRQVTGVCQADAREGQAGPGGESERSIVPSKPGNAGGGKGPWFKTSVESGMTAGRLVMNLEPLLTTVGKLQTALHAKA